MKDLHSQEHKVKKRRVFQHASHRTTTALKCAWHENASESGRRRGARKMEVHGMVEPYFEHVCISTVMGLLVLASLEGSAEGAALDSGRLTIRQYYYCLGGDLEGFACQGLADRTTCGTGGTCVEDLYVDACGNGYRMQLEECDDGNEFAGDGCSDTCSVELGWQCSGASEREPDKCSVVCGDGRQLDAGCCDSFVEADACSRECSAIWGCDDGNLQDGDGCSKECSVESGYDCWRGNLESFSPCLCSRTRVSASSEHTCAIDSDAKILCWGDNSYNKSANYFERTKGGAYSWPLGSWQQQNVFVSISAGGQHNCAAKFGGEIFCWGWIGPGVSGDGRIFMPPAPDWERNSGGGFLWGQISMGFAHSCGRLQENRFQYRPVCGKEETAGSGCPNREWCAGQCRKDGDWSLHWLERHPCFLSYVNQYTCTDPPNRTVVCWGADDYKQISMPVASTWKDLDSGWYHSCGVLANGTAACWGNNNYGQASVPTHTRKWIQVAAGGSHSCGVDEDRHLRCWGNHYDMQTVVPYPNSYLRVDAGWLHTCAIQSDQSLVCWGANDSGQCDVPFIDGRCEGGPRAGQACLSNTACGPDQYGIQGKCAGKKKRDWAQVSCGRLHTCGVDKSDRVFCWGSNQYGQSSMPNALTSERGRGGNGQPVVISSGLMTSPCL